METAGRVDVRENHEENKMNTIESQALSPLESVIVDTIRRSVHPVKLTTLVGLLRNEPEVVQHREKGLPVDRFIDRTLQRMRKAGQIEYVSSKIGWKVIER